MFIDLVRGLYAEVEVGCVILNEAERAHLQVAEIELFDEGYGIADGSMQ